MQPPECKLCKTKHYAHESHRFAPVSSRLSERIHAALDGETVYSAGTLHKRRWRAKNRERYNDYQRDYMRRWRSSDQ